MKNSSMLLRTLSARCLVVVSLLLMADPRALLFANAPLGTATTSYLPAKTKFNPAVPTPEAFLGFEIGSRHLTHEQLVSYLRALAKASDRVAIEEYGRSHGDRPLLLLTITSAANARQIEDLRKAHLRWADPQAAPQQNQTAADLPVVLNMGYGIHGNEPSATNAAPVVAYYLAAAQGKDVENLLNNVIVLLDPCLNPDGFERFAHWTNNHRGAIANDDRDHREHQETFPSGRTNYYWFDLNRDWLPLTQPESRARMKWYHRWLPNVVLDYHEMGTDNTYFFQPGVPRRKNPWIPARNLELTAKLGDFHAKALDEIGSAYFTKDQFDDYYPGKGSTYPDLHGAVGILFEQASSRGQVQESVNGPVSFPYTIRNQVATSISSLRGTLALQAELNQHQREFYQENLQLAKKDTTQGYVVSAPGDPQRLKLFQAWLDRQRLVYEPLTKRISADGRTYHPGEALLIPTAQRDYRFVQAVFEHRTQFEEAVFYDISAWTLPDAYGLTWSALEQWPGAKPTKHSKAGEDQARVAKGLAPMPKPAAFQGDEAACLIDWRGYHAPRLLQQLHAHDFEVKVAMQPFTAQVGEQSQELGYGTLLVPLGNQREKLPLLQKLLRQAAAEGVASFAVGSGLSLDGPDLGSRRFAPIQPRRALLVVGEGVSAYDAGEVWRLFDQTLQMPITLTDTHRLGSFEFGKYTTIVVVSGNYRAVPATAVEQLKRWVQQGGTLIACSEGVRWVVSTGLADAKFVNSPAPRESDAKARRPYAQAQAYAAKDLVRGVILKAEVDPTHPLGFGYDCREMAVMRTHETFLRPSDNAYSSPVVYRPGALLSGYMSKVNQELAENAASAVIDQQGRGRVVLLADNPNFRGYWLGTERLFVNAVFFGQLMGEP